MATIQGLMAQLYQVLIGQPILAILAAWGLIDIVRRALAMFRLLLCANCRKPRIKIEGEKGISLEPPGIVWKISISNEELRNWRKYFCRRDKISCWVEAGFIVKDEIPTLASNKEAYAIWREDLPERVTLEPDSSAYEIELMSQVLGEVGFHIKRLSPETLLAAEDVLAAVLVKTGSGKICAKATWAIYEYNGELTGERLE